MAGRRARRRAAAQEKEKAATKPSPAPDTAAKLKKPGKVTLREQSLLDRGIKSSLPPAKWAAKVRIRHLEQVAAWASATVPPLGAFLGARLAATCETEGLPPSGATLGSTCQRCESFLHLGVNCSVEEEEEEEKRKKKRKATGGKGKPCAYLLYICHYCKHRNRRPAPGPKKRAELMRKALAGKAAAELTPAMAATPQTEERKERSSHEGTGMLAGAQAQAPAPSPVPALAPALGWSLEVEREGNEVVSPAQTPSAASIRDDNDAAPAAELTSARPPAVASRFGTSAPSPRTPTPSGGGKKRKRKGWTSLKEIASQSVEQAKAVRTPIFSMGNSMLRNLYSSS